MSGKLNIGAGITFLPGFVNIDISPKADLQVDLNRERLPFESNSIELIFTYRYLEHLDKHLFAIW